VIGSRRKAHQAAIAAVGKGVPPNDAVKENLSRLDRVAIVITDRIGTMGFFFAIASWTVLWCGYNILASKVPSLHLHAFDPFPAFVAYLLISNVIQIMLMPLLMVGQNLQGRHSEARAENDYLVNQKAFADTEKILRQLEAQAEQMLRIEETNRQILEHLGQPGSPG
jgi:uncharacterized membrane protein